MTKTFKIRVFDLFPKLFAHAFVVFAFFSATRAVTTATFKTFFYNFDDFFGVPIAEVKANMKPRVVATSVNNIIEEYFATNNGLDAKVDGRITILE